MTLPPEYSSAEEYFEECISFMSRYRELYDRSNIDVLNDNLEFFVKLSDHDPTSNSDDNLDKLSRSFFKELTKLSPYYESFSSNGSDQPYVPLRMSRKKAHEVVHLTEEIKNVCEVVDCQTVVDLGAGLGYIDYQIFLETRFNVLGLEGQESFYVSAKEHQRKYHPESIDKVKYIRHLVTESSDTNIMTYLEDKFPFDQKGFCFMGLHACGDLTVSAIKLFLKMERCRALVVTPCCYHKMETEPNRVSGIKNFPLSETLKTIYREHRAHTYVSIQFLRVAAQPAHTRDLNIEDRVFYMIARAVLKVYAKKYNCIIKRKRRKSIELNGRDFAKYAEEAATKAFWLIPEAEAENNELTDEQKAIPFDVPELQSMWQMIPPATFTDAALYISYQNQLAPVFENFVLYDRLLFLKEQGVQGCHYKKVVNEAISPKCLSLFATKV